MSDWEHLVINGVDRIWANPSPPGQRRAWEFRVGQMIMIGAEPYEIVSMRWDYDKHKFDIKANPLPRFEP